MTLLSQAIYQTGTTIRERRILDTYSTGCQICHSLIKRSSSYSGSLIAQTGGLVTTWYDQSGNNNHALADTVNTGFQPTYTGVERYVQFSNSAPNTAYLISGMLFNALRTVGLSVYAVLYLTADPPGYSAYLMSRATGNNINGYGFVPAGTYGYFLYDFNESTPTYDYLGAKYALNTKLVYAITVGAKSTKQYLIQANEPMVVNTNIANAATMTAETTANNPFYIGKDPQGARDFGGYMSDLLAYNVLHSDAQVFDIMNRL